MSVLGNKLVVFLSDFGPGSPFVGVVKGVIKSIVPDVDIVDLAHNVAKFNVLEASLILSSAIPYFPKGTIFLAVVDPGVGSQRRALVIEGEKHLYVLPDNGLVTMVRSKDRLVRAIEINRFKPRSRTFHARDIFAPAAAMLVKGNMVDLGTEVPLESLTFLKLETPLISEEGGKISIKGKVIYVDTFGNLITNISGDDLEYALRKANPTDVVVYIANTRIVGLSDFYDTSKELVTILDSFDLLEIAVPQGNASEHLGVGLGEEVILEVDSEGTKHG